MSKAFEVLCCAAGFRPEVLRAQACVPLTPQRQRNPVAKRILGFVVRSTLSPSDIHRGCHMYTGEIGTRHTVAYVFQIPKTIPIPGPIPSWDDRARDSPEAPIEATAEATRLIGATSVG